MYFFLSVGNLQFSDEPYIAYFVSVSAFFFIFLEIQESLGIGFITFEGIQ